MKKKSKNIGGTIKEARLKMGMTQKNVADLLGYGSGQFISNAECGRSNLPIDKLMDLCTHLKIAPDLMVFLILEESKKKLREAFLT